MYGKIILRRALQIITILIIYLHPIDLLDGGVVLQNGRNIADSKNTIDYEQTTPKTNRKQRHTRHAQARHTPVSDSENSMLHGESISLSEDESESNYQSDGAVVLTHENVSDNRQQNHKCFSSYKTSC